MARARISLITSLFVYLLLSLTAYGQVDKANKFSNIQVSETLRARLIERFNLFVEYERTKQYEKQFDLHLPGHPLYGKENPDKESYARLKRKMAEKDGDLVELIVRHVDKKLDEDGGVYISVSVKLQRGNKVYKDEPLPIMVAYLRDKEWYFTLAYFYIPSAA